MVVKKSDVYKPSEIAMAVLSRGRVRKVNNNGAVQACRVVDSHDIDKDMHAQLPPLRANLAARSHKPMSISTVASFPAWLQFAWSSQLHGGVFSCICRTQSMDMK